jgi:chromosome segregation ATPase
MSLSRLYKTASTAAQEAKALAANVNKQQMQITKETINQSKDRGKAEAAAREKQKQKMDLSADLKNAALKAVTGFVAGTVMKAVGMYAAGQNAKASRENDATQKGMKTLNKKEELKGKIDAKEKEIDKKLETAKPGAERDKLVAEKAKLQDIKKEIESGEKPGGEFSNLENSINNHESLKQDGAGKDNLTKAESKLDDLEKKFDDATGANKTSTKIQGKIDKIDASMKVLEAQGKTDSKEYKDLASAKGKLEGLKKEAEGLEDSGKTDDVETKTKLKDISKQAKAVTSEKGANGTEVDDTLDSLEAATSAVDKVDKEIGQVNGDIEDVQKKIDKLDKNDPQYEQKLKGLNDLKGALEGSRDRLMTVKGKVDAAVKSGDKDAIKDATKEFAGVKRSADSVRAIAAEVAEIDDKIKGVDERIGKNNTEIKNLDAQIEELKKNPAADPKQIAGLEAKRNGLKKANETLETTKGKLEGARGKVEALGTKALDAVNKAKAVDKLDKDDPNYTKAAEEADTAMTGVGTALGQLSSAADLIEEIGLKTAAIDKKLGEVDPNSDEGQELTAAKGELAAQGKKVEDLLGGDKLGTEDFDKELGAVRTEFDGTSKGVAAADGKPEKKGVDRLLDPKDSKEKSKRYELDIKESFLSKMLKYYNNGQIKDVIGQALTKATYKAIKALSSRESAIHERVSGLILQMDMQKVAELQKKVQDAQKRAKEASSKYEKAMKESGNLERSVDDAKNNLAAKTGTTDEAGQKQAVSNAENTVMSYAQTDADGNTESMDEVVARLTADPAKFKELAEKNPELFKALEIVQAAHGVETTTKARDANARDASRGHEAMNKAVENDPGLFRQFFGAQKGVAELQAELDEAIGQMEGSLAYMRGLYTLKYGSDRPDLGETGKVSLFGLDFKVDDELQSMGKDLIDNANSTLASANATSEQTRDMLLGAVGSAYGGMVGTDDKEREKISKLLAKGQEARFHAAQAGLDELYALQKDFEDGKLGSGWGVGKTVSTIMTMGIGHIPGIHTGIAGDPSANDKSVSEKDRRDALSDIINDYKINVVNEGVAASSAMKDHANTYGSDIGSKKLGDEVRGFIGEMQVGDKGKMGKAIEAATKALDYIDGEKADEMAGVRGGGLLSVGGRLMTAETLGLDANAVKLNIMFSKAMALQKKAELVNGATSGTESAANLFTDPKFAKLNTESTAVMNLAEDKLADGKIDPTEIASVRSVAETLLNVVEEALNQEGLSDGQKDALKLQRDLLKGAISEFKSLEKAAAGGKYDKMSDHDRIEWANKAQGALGLVIAGSQQLNAKSVGEVGGWFGSTALYGGRTVAESGEMQARKELRTGLTHMLADAEAIVADPNSAEGKAKAELIKAIKEQLHHLDTFGADGMINMTKVQNAMENYGEAHAEAMGEAFQRSEGGVQAMMSALITSGADMAKGFSAAIAKMTNKDTDGPAFKKAVDDMETMVKNLHDTGAIDDATFKAANDLIAAMRDGMTGGVGSAGANAAATELGKLLGEKLAGANAVDLATKLIGSKGLTTAAATLIGIGKGAKDEADSKELKTSVKNTLDNMKVMRNMAFGTLDEFSKNLDASFSHNITQLNAAVSMLNETIDAMESMGMIDPAEAATMRSQVEAVHNAGVALLDPTRSKDRAALAKDFENAVGGLKTSFKKLTDATETGIIDGMTKGGMTSSMALRTVNGANRNLKDTVLDAVADGGLSTASMADGNAIAVMMQSDPKMAAQFKLAIANRLANGGAVNFDDLKLIFGSNIPTNVQNFFTQIKAADRITEKMRSGGTITMQDLEALFGKDLKSLSKSEKKDLLSEVEDYNGGKSGADLWTMISAARDKSVDGIQQQAGLVVGKELLKATTGDVQTGKAASFALSDDATSNLSDAVSILESDDASEWDKQQAYATISGVAGSAGLGAVTKEMSANAPTVSNLLGGFMVGLGSWAGMYADAMGKAQFSFRTSHAAGGMDAADAFDFVGRLGLKESDVLLGEDAFTKLGIVPAGMTPGSAGAALSQFLKGSYGASGAGAREAYLKLMNAIATGDGVGAQKAFEGLMNAFGSMVTSSESLMKELNDPNVKLSDTERKAKIAELQGLVDSMAAVQMLLPQVAKEATAKGFDLKSADGKTSLVGKTDANGNYVPGMVDGAMRAMVTEGMLAAKKNGTTFETYRDAYQILAKGDLTQGDIDTVTATIGKLEKRAGDLQQKVDDKLHQLAEMRANGQGGTIEYARVMAELEAATLELGQITQMVGSLGRQTENDDGTVKKGMEGLHKTLVDTGVKSARAINAATVDAKGHATGMADVGNLSALEDGRGMQADQDAAALRGKSQDFADAVQDYLDAGDYAKAAQVIQEFFGKKGDMMDQFIQLLGADNPKVQALLKAKDRIEKLIDPKTGRILDSGKMKDAVKDFMQAYREADDLVADRFGTEESTGTSSVSYSQNAAMETAIKLSDGLRERIAKALADKGGPGKLLNAANAADVQAVLEEAYNDGLIGEADMLSLRRDFAKAKSGDDFQKLMAQVQNVTDRFETTAMTKATAGIQFEGALKGLAKATNGDDRQMAVDNANDAIDDMLKAGILTESQAKTLKTMVKALAGGSDGDLDANATGDQILAARNEMASAIKVLQDLKLVDDETSGALTEALAKADSAIGVAAATGTVGMGGIPARLAIDAVNDLRDQLRTAIKEDVIGKVADGTASAIFKEFGVSVEMEAADPKEAYDNMRRNLLTRAQTTVADLMKKGDTDALTTGEKLALQSAIDVLELNGNLTSDEAAGLRAAVDTGDVAALKKTLGETPKDGQSIADRVANAHLSAASVVMNRLSSTAEERGFIEQLSSYKASLMERLKANPGDAGAKDELKVLIDQMKALGLVTAEKADELKGAVMAGDAGVSAQLDALLDTKDGPNVGAQMKDLASTDTAVRDKAVASLKDGVDKALAAGKITKAQADSLKARIDQVAAGNKTVNVATLERELQMTGGAKQRFETRFSAAGFAGNADLARRMRGLAFQSAQAEVAKAFFDNLAKVDLKKLKTEDPAAYAAMMAQLGQQAKALMNAGVLSEEFGTELLGNIEKGDLHALAKDIDRADELIGTHKEIVDKALLRDRGALGDKIAETLAADVDDLQYRINTTQAFNSAENRADVLTQLDKVIARAEALASTTGDTATAALVAELKRLKGELNGSDLNGVQDDRLSKSKAALADIKTLAGSLRDHLEAEHGVGFGDSTGKADVTQMAKNATDDALVLAQAILKDGKVDGSNLVLVAEGLEQDLDGLVSQPEADPALVAASKRLDVATRAYEALITDANATPEQKAKAKTELLAAVKDVELALLKQRPGVKGVTVTVSPTVPVTGGTTVAPDANLGNVAQTVKVENDFVYTQGGTSSVNGEDAGDTPAMVELKKQRSRKDRELTDTRTNLNNRLFGVADGATGDFHNLADYVATYVAFKGSDGEKGIDRLNKTQKLNFATGSADYQLAQALLTPGEQMSLLAKAATSADARNQVATIMQARLRALDGLTTGESLDQVKADLKAAGLEDAGLDAFLTSKGILGADGTTVDKQAARDFAMGDDLRTALIAQTKKAVTDFDNKTSETLQDATLINQFVFLKGANAGKANAAAAMSKVAVGLDKSVKAMDAAEIALDDIDKKIAKQGDKETEEAGGYTEAMRLTVKSETIDKLKAERDEGKNTLTDAQIEEIGEVVSQLEQFRRKGQDRDKLIDIAKAMGTSLDRANLSGADRTKALGTLLESVKAGLSGDLKQADANINEFIAKSLGAYLAVERVKAKDDFVKKFTAYKDQLSGAGWTLGDSAGSEQEQADAVLGMKVSDALDNLTEAQIKAAYDKFGGDAKKAMQYLLSTEVLGEGADGNLVADKISGDLIGKQTKFRTESAVLSRAYDLLRDKQIVDQSGRGRSTINNFLANTDNEAAVLRIIGEHGGKIDQDTWADLQKSPEAMAALKQALGGRDITTFDGAVRAIGHMAKRLASQTSNLAKLNSGEMAQYFGSAAKMNEAITKLAVLDGYKGDKSVLGADGTVAGLTGADFTTLSTQIKQAHDEVGAFAKLDAKTLLEKKTYADAMATDAGDNLAFYQNVAAEMATTIGTSEALQDVETLQKTAAADAETGHVAAQKDQEKQVTLANELFESTGIDVAETLGFKTQAADALGFGNTKFLRQAAIEMAGALLKMLSSQKSGNDSTVDMESIGKDADKAGKDALKAQEEIRKKLEKLAKKLKDDRIAAEQSDVKEYIKRLGKEYEVAAGNLILARKAVSTALASGNVAAAQAAMTALLSAAKTFESVKDAVKALSDRDAAANGGGDNHSQDFLAFKDSIKDLEKATDQILNELKSGVLQDAVRKMGGTPQEKAEAMASMGNLPGEAVTKGMSTGAIVKQVLRSLESDDVGGSKKKGSAKDDDDTLSADDVRTLFAFADGERVTSTKEGRRRLQDLIDQAGKAGNSGDPAKAIQLASQIKALLADTASDPTGTGINLSKQQRGALAALANVIEHNASMMGKAPVDDDDKEILKIQAGNAQLLLADVMRLNKGELSDDTVVVGAPDKSETQPKGPASLADRYKEASAKVRQADKQLDSPGKVESRLKEIEALLTPTELAALQTDAGNGAEVLAKIRAAVKEGNLTGSSSGARALLAKLEATLNTAALAPENQGPKTTVTPSVTSTSTVTTTPKGDKVEPTNHKGGSTVTMNDVMQSKGDLVSYDNLFALLPKMRKQEAGGDLVTYDPRFAVVDQSRTTAIAARDKFDKAADTYYKAAQSQQAAEGTYLDALNVERLATKGYEIAGMGQTNAALTKDGDYFSGHIGELKQLKDGAQALLDAKVTRNGKEEFLVTDEATRKQLKSLATGDGKVTADQLAAVQTATGLAKERITQATNKMDGAKKDMDVQREVFVKADAKLQEDMQTLRSGIGSGVLGGEYSMSGSLNASIDAYKKVLGQMLEYEQDNATFDDTHVEQASRLKATQGSLSTKKSTLLAAVESDAGYLQIAKDAGQKTKGNLTSDLADTQTSIVALDKRIQGTTTKQDGLKKEIDDLVGYRAKMQDVDAAYRDLKAAWEASKGDVNNADVQAKTATLKAALAALPATAPKEAAADLKAVTDNGNLLVKLVETKDKTKADAINLQFKGDATKQNLGASISGALGNSDVAISAKNKQFAENQQSLSGDVTVRDQLRGRETKLKKDIGAIAIDGNDDPSSRLTAVSKKAGEVHADGLEAAAALDEVGTRLGSPGKVVNPAKKGDEITTDETVSDGGDGRALTSREQRLISEIDQMDKFKKKVEAADNLGSTGEKNAALNKVRTEMKGSALGESVGAKRQEKEQEVKKAYKSYLNAEMRVIEAKERGASSDEIHGLERKAKQLERQYNVTNGRTWRDGLIAAFGGESGKYALMALKYGLELIMEAIKQQKRVQELEGLLAKAVADEKKLAVEMAMYSAGPRRA